MTRPPDLTALRRQLAEATARHHARTQRRLDALAELRAATPDAPVPPSTEPEPPPSKETP